MFKKSTAPSAGGFTLSKSLRFRSSASAYLNRTFSTPTSSTIWTWSSWIKRGGLTGTYRLFGASTTTFLTFNSSDQLNLTINNVSAATSTAVFRDPAAWYHVVYQQNGSAQTIYVNNVSVATGTTAAAIFNTAIAHQIGAANTTNYFDGYMANVQFVDGQALTPTSFGSFSGTGGVWQPIAYTGTYGTNGFYLPFTDATSTATLGNDSSGNGNTWTTNNISVTAGVTYDSMTDVPTLTSATVANYCVLNPLWQGRTNLPTDGNLNYGASSVGIGTMDVSLFSSYWEITSTGGTTSASVYSTSAASTVSVTTGLTYGFKFNSSTGALDYTTNGSSFTSLATGLTSGPYFVYVSTAASTTASFNGGQRPFAYTPPSGFVALNTYNLPTPTIAAGNKYMDATLYTGTGSSLTVTNAGSFKPDLVWVKSRSAATDHKLTDSVRGVTKSLESNTTDAEATDTQGLTTFGSSGFTVGTNTDYNNSAVTYVGWQWQAGQSSGSSNTNGSITSTVSVSTTAGFSVVIYTGTGANATVGHGLGVVPQFITVKSRSQAGGYWRVYSPVIGAANALFLNDTLATTLAATIWNSTTPTSSVFSIGTDIYTNTSGETYVGYCWTPIAGFSQFGGYTGNGSTDGPFVYLGFRPKFLLVKRTDAAGGWVILDESRNTFNVTNTALYPNKSDAEVTPDDAMDFLSNGFKFRSSGGDNTVGSYIYAAFAENPFKYALAR